MTFTCSTEINLPASRVFELFVNKNNLKEWQKELMGYEHISGTPGEVGAVTELKYRSVTIFETITSKNMPSEMSGVYEHKRGAKPVMVHKASNRFSSLGETNTLYETELEFTQAFGFLPKVMLALMGGVVKRYHQNLLDQFKAFAEKKAITG